MESGRDGADLLASDCADSREFSKIISDLTKIQAASSQQIEKVETYGASRAVPCHSAGSCVVVRTSPEDSKSKLYDSLAFVSKSLSWSAKHERYSVAGLHTCHQLRRLAHEYTRLHLPFPLPINKSLFLSPALSISALNVVSLLVSCLCTPSAPLIIAPPPITPPLPFGPIP